jgi:hypothetical protein
VSKGLVPLDYNPDVHTMIVEEGQAVLLLPALVRSKTLVAAAGLMRGFWAGCTA